MAANFVDRRDAGRKLGASLARMDLDDPLILGIARGGVIVAAEAAAVLDAELGVSIARKLGAPRNPELGIGAVTPDGTVFLDEEIVGATGASRGYLDGEIARETAEARRRLDAFAGEHRAEPRGRTVVLIDDGIATGVTAKAALRALRRAGAKRVILAAPCAPPRAVAEFQAEADEVVVLVVDPDFMATGQYYRDFRPVTDREVRDALASAKRPRSRSGT